MVILKSYFELLLLNAGFQADPTFPYFLCSYFPLHFIKMPYYPYFLGQKFFEVTKMYFVSLLALLARSLEKSDQLYLSRHDIKVYKIILIQL